MAAAATRRARRIPGAGALLCAAALIFPTLPAQAKTWTVKITGMRFEPAKVTVARGDTIDWVNEDLVAHSVTSAAAGRFDSHAIAPGGKWRYRAMASGRYPYACTFHPTMQATLIVKEKP